MLQYLQFVLQGVSALLTNSAGAMDPFHPLAIEKRDLAAKKESSRSPTEIGRLRWIDAFRSAYQTPDGKPTFPTGGIRAVIDEAARKSRQGPKVKQGLLVFGLTFDWDHSLGETVSELASNEAARLTVPVMQQGKNRVLRTRMVFPVPWSITANIGFEPDLLAPEDIKRFLDIAGNRLGIGDWRPGKSGGEYGRFKVESMKAMDESFQREIEAPAG